MDSLPIGDDLKDIQESNRKHGVLKTFRDQIQSKWLPILFILYAAYDQRIDKLYYNPQIQLQTESSFVQDNNFFVSDESSKKISSNSRDTKLGETLGIDTEFNPEEWYIESFSIDKEGYYCPTTSKFDYWSIWSKSTYSPNINSIQIRVLTKTKQGSTLPPTLAISYGEFKPNLSPIQFYRLNIFDTDLKSIRLYNANEDSVAQDWLSENPELKSEMSFKLSPRSIDPNSRILNLNPRIEYASPNKDKPIVYSPNEDSLFQITLPTVGIEDGTVKKQIGIGSSKESCFKPIAIIVVE